MVLSCKPSDGYLDSFILCIRIGVLQVLNQIVFELPAEHPLAESRPLRELLGHTPLQVWLNELDYCRVYLDTSLIICLSQVKLMFDYYHLW